MRLIALVTGMILFATPVRAQDDFAPVEAAVRRCLGYSSGQIPQVSNPALVPPGLIGGQAVKVEKIGGTTLKAFVYEGASPRIMSCGVAIYGPVPDAVRSRIVQLIVQSRADLTPRHDNPWKWDGPPAEESYWGRSGITGVLLKTRTPRDDAPTLDVQYHNMLMF